MKKTPLLNVALSRVIAGMGHGDILVIGDAGLPVPPGGHYAWPAGLRQRAAGGAERIAG